MKQVSYSINWQLILLLGLAAGIANNCIMQLAFHFSLGLYMDTLFTVAVTFFGGLLPGLVCAILTTVIFGITYGIITGASYFWAWYFYILCSIAAVFLVRFFIRLFPKECESVRFVRQDGPHSFQQSFQQSLGPLFMLIVLSLVMCILMSVIGGLISTGISMAGNVVPEDIPPETWFRLGFIRQGFSLIPSEILGRVPVNLADRPVAVFGGYGIALLAKRFFLHRRTKAEAPPAAP